MGLGRARGRASCTKPWELWWDHSRGRRGAGQGERQGSWGEQGRRPRAATAEILCAGGWVGTVAAPAGGSGPGEAGIAFPSAGKVGTEGAQLYRAGTAGILPSRGLEREEEAGAAWPTLAQPKQAGEGLVLARGKGKAEGVRRWQGRAREGSRTLGERQRAVGGQRGGEGGGVDTEEGAWRSVEFGEAEDDAAAAKGGGKRQGDGRAV